MSWGPPDGEEQTVNVLAAVFAILAILAELLAFFGARVGDSDLAVLGLAFMAATLLCMCIPTVWPRRAA